MIGVTLFNAAWIAALCILAGAPIAVLLLLLVVTIGMGVIAS